MKKILGLVLVAIILSGCGEDKNKKSQHLYSSGPGNGGAAIVRNGDTLTFGEESVKIFREPLEDVPGLNLAISFLKRLPLPSVNRGQIISALTPVGARQYFRIDENDLGVKKRQILLQKYRDALGDMIPQDSLRIVAFTVGTETYLLPGFFQLKDDFNRAAILFHEALWVMNPKLSYKLVLASEIHFEKYLRENSSQSKIGFNSKFMQTMKMVTGDALLGIAAASRFEFSQGNNVSYEMVDSGKAKKFNKPEFQLNEILGKEAVQSADLADHLNPNLAFDYFDRMVDANPTSVLWREWLIEAKGLDLYRVVRWWVPGEGVSDIIGWSGGIGKEVFDPRRSGANTPDGNYSGIAGSGGEIGKQTDQHNGYHSALIAMYIVSNEMQVRVPRAIIQDKEKCEEVTLYWDKEENKPVTYQRCFEQWVED